MTTMIRLAMVSLFAASLAACAQPTAQNFEAPPAKRVDAKTALETGRAERGAPPSSS